MPSLVLRLVIIELESGRNEDYTIALTMSS
jgi:hypothetical protein